MSESSNDSNKPNTAHRWASPFVHVRWEHLVAGVSGGVASTITLHPLDLLKIRFQVNEGVSVGVNRPQYNGIADAVKKIYTQDGVRGFYQGVTPNVWGAGMSWGLYFFFYNAIKGHKLAEQDVSTLSAGQHIISAALAGAFTLSLTNPVWVAKTRLCLQYDKYAPRPAGGPAVEHYRGMFDCLVKIYKADGVRGLYKGFIPGIVGVSHGALQFMAYEELKKFYNGYLDRPLDTKFSSTEYLTFAAISKVFAASITYPYQVVRARLQDQHRSYNGLKDCIMQTWRQERLFGFYKGIPPYLLHVTPNICIVLLVYETIVEAAESHRLRQQIHEEQSLDNASTQAPLGGSARLLGVDKPTEAELSATKDEQSTTSTEKEKHKSIFRIVMNFIKSGDS